MMQMKVTLIKSGGFIGKKMTATASWHFTASDWKELTNIIRREENGGKKRDAFNYSLQQDDDDTTKVPINIQLVPEKYTALFKELFDNMKAEK
jgi:hypothetical protein